MLVDVIRNHPLGDNVLADDHRDGKLFDQLRRSPFCALVRVQEEVRNHLVAGLVAGRVRLPIERREAPDLRQHGGANAVVAPKHLHVGVEVLLSLAVDVVEPREKSVSRRTAPADPRDNPLVGAVGVGGEAVVSHDTGRGSARCAKW